MQDADFRLWLENKRSIKGRYLSDIMSRCRRIERLLDMSLDSAVASEQKLNRAISYLGHNSKTYLRRGADSKSVSMLRVAVRYYAEFINFKRG
jgi:hypothetical protein